MGLFDKAKAKLQEKLDEISAPEAEPSVETLAKQATSIAIVGSEYPCRKDKKIMRSTAEKGIRIGSQVTIERYTYQGEITDSFSDASGSNCWKVYLDLND